MYYKRIESLLDRPYDKSLYKELYAVMRLLCDEFVGQEVFSNFFSQLGYVCEQRHIPQALAAGLQQLRRKVNHADEIQETDFLTDVHLLTAFVQRLYGGSVPESLARRLPAELPHVVAHGAVKKEYASLRVRVQAVDAQYIYALKDDADAITPIRIDYMNAGSDGDLAYVAELVHRDSTLNLLKVKVTDDDVYVPQWIIFEPDYLMSPSEVAGVFEPQGASPYNYLLKQLSPSEKTVAILLGNAAGIFLDDLLQEAQQIKVQQNEGQSQGDANCQTSDADKAAERITYAQSATRAFCQYPIDIALLVDTPELSRQFHRDAEIQFNNIRQLLDTQLEFTYGFDISKALLEPSFVCPAVGLAGRMDYLQSDGHKLIEQKSGKRDEFRNTHREPHFVQTMLYQLMIEHTLGVKHDECQAYLLYSRYVDALMLDRPYQVLLRQAMEMRNRIVSVIERCCNGELPDMMAALKVEDFRTAAVSDKFWSLYAAPRISESLAPFKEGNALVRDYVYRFLRFLMREQWVARMGAPGGGAHGYADLWNNPALVRAENGDLLSGLRVADVHLSADGVQTVTLLIPDTLRDVQTNFRQGDAVQIYSYTSGEPNVSRQITLRGKLAQLMPSEAVVVLNSAQRNGELFEGADRLFALEHDHIESGNAVFYRGLTALLAADSAVQDRFLLRQLPKVAEPAALIGNYGSLNELVAKERAASDFFLVIGPPGSGKTSCALRYMVEEELRASSSGRILLMAYTNRAVDELCGMLENIIADTPSLLSDYLRIGQPLSAAEQYSHRLLRQRVGRSVKKAAQLRQLLADTRIVVATVSTMSQQQLLLGALSFDVAFIDEASQILEPHLLPVYTSGRVGRYVLVGDQKQLPAVVQQSTDAAAIDSAALNALGITNCATSLFDRILHRFMAQGRTDLYHQLTVQGRMHPDLYGFVNQYFYGSRLLPVPLPHQQRDIADLYPLLPAEPSPLTSLLARQRTLFVDIQPKNDGVNDKINSAEAEAVVECLKSLAALYEANGLQFTPQEVGIIVPYRNQISMIRSVMQEHGLNHLLGVTIDTVERYQGSQRNVIIYTFTVRHESQLQFLTSSVYTETDNLCDASYPVDRKLNVALTRAREQMIVVGNKELLSAVPLFKAMLHDVPQITLSE